MHCDPTTLITLYSLVKLYINDTGIQTLGVYRGFRGSQVSSRVPSV